MAFMGIFILMLIFAAIGLAMLAGFIALKILAIAAVFWGTVTAIAAAVIYKVLKKNGKLSRDYIDSLTELPAGKLRRFGMKALKTVLIAAMPLAAITVILSASYLLFDPMNAQIAEHIRTSSYSEEI